MFLPILAAVIILRGCCYQFPPPHHVQLTKIDARHALRLQCLRCECQEAFQNIFSGRRAQAWGIQNSRQFTLGCACLPCKMKLLF